MFNMDEYKKTLTKRSDALNEYLNNDIIIHAYRCDTDAAKARQLSMDWDDTNDCPELYLEKQHYDYIMARDNVETFMFMFYYRFGMYLFIHKRSLEELRSFSLEELKTSKDFINKYEDLLLREKSVLDDPQIDNMLFKEYKKVRHNDNQALCLALSRLGFYNALNEVDTINENSQIFNAVLL